MGSVADTFRGAVARVNAVVQRRQAMHVIPSEEATLKSLAKDPHVTVKLTDEQAERLHDIETASESTAAPGRPVGA